SDRRHAKRADHGRRVARDGLGVGAARRDRRFRDHRHLGALDAAVWPGACCRGGAGEPDLVGMGVRAVSLHSADVDAHSRRRRATHHARAVARRLDRRCTDSDSVASLSPSHVRSRAPFFAFLDQEFQGAMNRRDFNAAMLGGLAGSAIKPIDLRSMFALTRITPLATPRVNGERLNAHVQALSAYGKNPEGGVSRVAYSDADKAGRAVVMDWMRAAKREPTIDFAGNIIARRAGRDASRKPSLFASDIDSVPGGGSSDGDVGSLSAIEIARTFGELGTV